MTREDIAERLAAADEDVSDQQLTEILQRLVDCGQLLQAQRQLGFPMSYVVSDRWDYVAGRWDYDAVDDLGASICAVLRGRDEIGYTDDEQLKGWLSEAGVTDFDDRQLGLAIGHLFRMGRLQTPRPDQWERKEARPTWLNEPRVHIG